MAKKAAGGVSKMDAMRQVLASLGAGASNDSIKDQLKSQFNLVLTDAMFSNYKSTVLKGKKKKKAAVTTTTADPFPPLDPTKFYPHSSGEKDDPSFKSSDIKQVREIAEKLGGDKVRALLSLLGK